MRLILCLYLLCFLTPVDGQIIRDRIQVESELLSQELTSRNLSFGYLGFLSRKPSSGSLSDVGRWHSTIQFHDGAPSNQLSGFYLIEPYKDIKLKTIYSIYGDEILKHLFDLINNEDYAISDIPTDILYYPADGNPHITDMKGQELVLDHHLLDFFDANQNDKYEPLLGDYPCLKIKNEILIPYVLNAKLGIYQEGNIELDFSSVSAMNNCGNEKQDQYIFNRIKIYNDSDRDYDDLKFLMFDDSSIECYADDMVGVDTLRNTTFSYNAFDKTQNTVFCPGGASQTINIDAYIASIYFNQPIHGYSYGINGGLASVLNEAIIANYKVRHAGDRVNFQWNDGTPWTKDGTGYDTSSSDLTRFCIPGDPDNPFEWSANYHLPVGNDYYNIPVFSLGKFERGEYYNFDYLEYIFVDDNLDTIDTHDRFVERVERLQKNYELEPQLLICNETYSPCESNCIIPGDVNNDGFVDNFDRLLSNTFKNLDQLGPKRDISFAQVSYYAPDWGVEEYGIDLKHFDVNGDGKIDNEDFTSLSMILDRSPGSDHEIPIREEYVISESCIDVDFFDIDDEKISFTLVDENGVFYDQDFVSFDIEFDTSIFTFWADRSWNDHLHENGKLLENGRSYGDPTIDLFHRKNLQLNQFYFREAFNPVEFSGPFLFKVKNIFGLKGDVITSFCSNNLMIQNTLLSASSDEETLVKVSPNPSTHNLMITAPTNNYNYFISDISGKIILYGVSEDYQKMVDIKTLQSGIYILKLINQRDKSQSTTRFIKI